MPTDETQFAVLNTKVDRMGEDVRDIKEGMAQNYVTKYEYAPLKEKVESMQKGLFWLIGIIAVSLIAAFFKSIGVAI